LKEKVERKNRCREILYKIPFGLKNLTLYCFDRLLKGPAKYLMSKTNELQSVLGYFVKTKLSNKKD